MAAENPKPPRPRSLPRGVSWEPWQRTDGTWVPSMRLRYTVDGRRESQRVDNVRDARDLLAQLQLDRRSGRLAELDRARMLLREFISDVWWPERATVDLAESTLKIYRHVLATQIVDRIGHLALRDVSSRVVHRMKAAMQRDGVGDPTIAKSLGVLQSVLSYAVEIGELEHNVVRNVRKPPSTSRITAVDPPAPLIVEQIRVQVDSTSALMISLMAYAGLRPQELYGLSWRQIGARQLIVDQKDVNGKIVKGQKVRGKPPRTVPLLEPLVADLAAYRRQAARPRGEQLLFPDASGEPWSDDLRRNWRKRIWRPAKEAAVGKARRIRPYDLRHAYASLRLYEGRYSPAEIAGQLGHSLDTLLKDYAHVISDIAAGSGQADPVALITAARAEAQANKTTTNEETNHA